MFCNQSSMKTLEKVNLWKMGVYKMTVTVAVSDYIFDEEDNKSQNLSKDFEQAYIVWKYLNARISIGKFAELLNMDLEGAKQFLHTIGIPTSRSLGSNLDSVMQENMEKVAESLGVKI